MYKTSKSAFQSKLQAHLTLMFSYSKDMRNYPSPPLFGGKSTEELKADYNNFISKRKYLESEISQNLNSFINSKIITESDIPWFDIANTRMCFFIWYNCIKIQIISKIYNTSVSLVPTLQGDSAIHNPPIYLSDNIIISRIPEIIFGYEYKKHMELNQSPTTQSCWEETLAFMSILNIDKHKKVAFLECIHQLYLSAYKIDSFSWLDKTDENWALEYIKDTILKYKGISHLFPSSFPAIHYKDVIILLFDVSSISNDEKSESLKKLKKAWQQQKHRNKLNEKNKKNYNYIMHENIGNKINTIKSQWEERANSGNSEPWNKRIFNKNEILEMLIDAEFERLKNIPPEEIK